MLEWPKNVPLQMMTAKVLPFKKGYPLPASKDDILVNCLYLECRSVNFLSLSRSLKHLLKVYVQGRFEKYLLGKVTAIYQIN